MNKMKSVKTSELRRTRRRWRKPIAKCGEKVWFRTIGEDGVMSVASRCVLPRMELCENTFEMLRTGMACVARRGKWSSS